MLLGRKDISFKSLQKEENASHFLPTILVGHLWLHRGTYTFVFPSQCEVISSAGTSITSSNNDKILFLMSQILRNGCHWAYVRVCAA